MATQKRVVLGDLAIGNAEEQISGKMEREDDSGENAAVEGLVTKEMVEEEARAHVETERGFQESLKEMQSHAFDHEEKEKRAKRLKFLVDRASIYSKWLAEKLEARQIEQQGAAIALEKKEAEEALLKEQSNEEVHVEGSQTVAIADATTSEQLIESEKRNNSPARKSSRLRQAPANYEPQATKKQRKVTEQTRRKRVKATFGLQSVSGMAANPLPKRTGRQPVLVTGGEMRDYQLAGMEWLISLYDNGLNGILGDEMGLGKTLQSIAFLAHLREMGTLGPFLIVAPLTTLNNWVSEVQRFTPDIPVVLYHGTPAERGYLRNHKLRFDDDSFPIVVTSYEICMNDRKHLQQIMWRYIIVDEGHRIKNMNCRLLRELKAYHSANRLLLTGTPLQNNLSELWSLLNFLMPDIFDDLSAFEEWFEFANDLSTLEDNSGSDTQLLNQEQSSGLVNTLHQILKPFLLRRLKTDVLMELPKKREYILYAPLTPKQKELYDAAINGTLREKLTASLHAMNGNGKENDEKEVKELSLREERAQRRKATVDYDEKSDRDYFKSLETVEVLPITKARQDGGEVKRAINAQKLQGVIIQLRKVCNHPYLFNIGEEELPYSFAEGQLAAKYNKKTPEIVQWSGKMLLLERLLPALFERGHKVLIFSQMTRALDIISDWCDLVKGWSFCRIDGNIRIDERRSQINMFNTDPDSKLFLLSTRAGGLGINLTAADTVIIFDSDWNPQADLQAQDRAHRLGQTKPVVVYRLVTAGSVESKIIDKANEKRKLEKLVIHKGQFKGSKRYYENNTQLGITDLARAMADETEKVSSTSSLNPEDILSNEDLERILDRSPEAYESAASQDHGKFKVVDDEDEVAVV